METTSCPWCSSSLPQAALTQVCPTCGKAVRPDDTATTPQTPKKTGPDSELTVNDANPNIQTRPRRAVFTLPHFSLLGNGLPFHFPGFGGKHQSKKHNDERFADRLAFSMPLTLDPLDEEQFTGELQDHAADDNDLSTLRPDGQLTWQKVVEPSQHRQSYTYPPRPPAPEDERAGGGLALARVSQPSITLPAFKNPVPSKLRRPSSKLVFWISIVVLLIIIGLFSFVNTLGHGNVSTLNIDDRLSLQITPNDLSVGATMTLRGNHFSPRASIGLTRDNAIPVADTFGSVFTQADPTGQFTDTIIVGDDWGAGAHTIMAEDSIKHQVASFPIMIDGKGVSLRPPHLHLSVNSLDFGAGDQATNTTEALTLLNNGNSEITWQESTSQPWLLMTPTQGTFTNDISQQVTIAVDRSQLQPGSYTAQVNFSSNGGNESLAVAMTVTPLKPEHDAIMQISPAVLSFTAVDGSSTATPQQITISNSGGQSMKWSTSANVPWLNVAPPSTAIAPNTFTNAKVSVVTRNLLPGTYTGTLTFAAQNLIGNGNAFHSPQQIVVSITIMPPCILLTDSGMVNFSSAYLQPGPSAKTINVTASAGCLAPLTWNATSNTAWLSLNNTRGTTPGTLSIGINIAGLTPNTYAGTITLDSSAGTQTIVVTFMLGPAGSAVISVGPPSLSFSSIAGQGGPAVQTLRLANTGGGVLNWQANAIPNLNVNWLQVTPNSGTLSSRQAITLTVSVMSSTMLPSGNYNGSIVLTGNNGAGQSAIGTLQSIPISYTIRPACTLLSPSTSGLNFSTIAGINPASQSFSIGVTGACDSAVTITTTTATDGGNWLTVSPNSATITTGLPGTFTVNLNGNTITSGQHSGTITLAATMNGSSIAGSSQTINVAFAVTAAPFLVTTPSTININVPGGNTSSPINIANTGGSPLNWVATLSGDVPAFISLSATTGSNLAGGASVSFNVLVNPNGVASGTYQTSVTVRASGSASGLPVTGSPSIVPITVVIASPVMLLDNTNVNFSGLTSDTIPSQSVTITNTGGGILSWTVSSPTQSWLSINATTGSTVMGTSSTLTFSVQTNGLSASSTPYTDQIVITPSVGNSITINIFLSLSDPAPTPTPVPTATDTPTPDALPTSASTPTVIVVPPTPTSLPTAIPPSSTPTTLVSVRRDIEV
jgi:Viral BACON domain